MRNQLAQVIILAVVIGTGCGRENGSPAPKSSASPQPPLAAKPGADVLAQIHFVGSSQLLADKKAVAKLNEIADLPETDTLKEQVLAKLSTAPCRFLQERQKLPGDANDESDLLEPLLGDLVTNESFAELRGPTNAVPDLLLAVHLGNERAALWETNLSTVLKVWTGLPVNNIQAEGYSGWELKKHQPPNLVRFLRAGDWAVFAWGQNEIPALPPMLQKIKAEGHPAAAMQEHWLEAWFDWPHLLSRNLSASLPFKVPTMQLGVGMRDDNIRSKVVFQFPDPLNLTLPEWKFPTNLIHNPIVNFTAARGIAPLLSQIEFLKQLQPDPMPNQFCAWAMFGVPFETTAAFPVQNASNFVQQVGTRLISMENSNLIAEGMGHLDWDETHTTLKLVGIIPMVGPYLTSAASGNGEFALAGLFPTVNRTRAAPPELFAQMIGHSNQVYYDWELTGERVNQWWNLIMLRHMIAAESIGGTNAPASRWITAISSRAGNGATEVTVTGPNELTLIRKSPLGLTGGELAWLLSWEKAPGFPLHGDYPHAGQARAALGGAQNGSAALQAGPAPPN
jgi:hypothetical protein